jgi:hypothetical protein
MRRRIRVRSRYTYACIYINLYLYIATLSYEEEDTCHMRRRIQSLERLTASLRAPSVRHIKNTCHMRRRIQSLEHPTASLLTTGSLPLPTLSPAPSLLSQLGPHEQSKVVRTSDYLWRENTLIRGGVMCVPSTHDI